MNSYKADLHVHSSHSNKPTYWAMRKFNVPESYTSPQYLYKTARDRGMDFVTITDHNAISMSSDLGDMRSRGDAKPDRQGQVGDTAHAADKGFKVRR